MSIEEEYLNFLLNKLCVDEVLPIAFKIVINWGSALKTKHETWKEYLRKNPHWIIDANFLKTNTDNGKLLKTDLENFDVTFLSQFSKIICQDKVAKPKSPLYQNNVQNPATVEYALNKINETRNTFSHKFDDAKEASWFSKMKEMVELCVNNAADLYNIDSVERASKFNEVEKKLNELTSNVPIKSKRIEFLINLIKRNGVDELREWWKRNCTSITLPASCEVKVTRSDIFHCMKLGTQDQEVISCRDLFTSTKNNIKVIYGPYGSGKTTLMATVVEKWLSIGKSTWNFSGVDQFDFVLFAGCRTDQCDSIISLIKHQLQSTLYGCPDGEVLEVFAEMNTLIILDGFDESNPSSEKLVWSAAELCQKLPTITLVISTRPHSSKDLSHELSSRNAKHEIISIREISNTSECVDILTAYAQVLIKENEQKQKMFDIFNSFPDRLKRIFLRPLLLALFVFLFNAEESAVANWKNECNIYNAVQTLLFDKIHTSLKDSGCNANLNIIVEEIMNKICNVCLKLYLQQKVVLKEKDFIELCKCCHSIINKYGSPNSQIDVKKVLSHVFSSGYSLSALDKNSYQLFHGSMLDFFASKSALKGVMEEKLSISSIIQIQLLDSSEVNMKRYICLFDNFKLF